jgi:transcriptional regulator with XRE-family HTH domain
MESEIGKRIKHLRGELNRKQSEFAEDLETTQGNISQIENGSCIPTGNFFLRMAKHYPDINFHWVITGEGSPLISVAGTVDLFSSNSSESVAVKRLEKEAAALRQEILKHQQRQATLLDLLESKRQGDK